MELKVRAVEGSENKSKAQIEENLLTKHEEEFENKKNHKQLKKLKKWLKNNLKLRMKIKLPHQS